MGEASPIKGTYGGQVDMFIKMTGVKQGWIKGDSADHKHAGEIDVLSYVWGVVQGFTTDGLATGKRQHLQLKFLTKSSAATPLILQACCTNEVLKDVVLTCRKASGKQEEYLVWKLTNASVAGVKTGYLVPEDIIPHDEVSLVYQKIELAYPPKGLMFLDDRGMSR